MVDSPKEKQFYAIFNRSGGKGGLAIVEGYQTNILGVFRGKLSAEEGLLRFGVEKEILVQMDGETG